MFLRKLKLQNVRSIEELEISFENADENTRKWTLLLGENGTGKSSVLRSIALVMAGSEALADLLVNTDTWIRVGKKECTIEAELITADKKQRDVKLTIRRGDKIRDVFSRNKETMDLLDRAIEHAGRNYITIGYGVSRRLSEDKSISRQESMKSPRAQCVATLFKPDAKLMPLESWAMDLDYRRPDGWRVVKNALNEFLPNVKFKRIDKEHKRLIFKTPDGDVQLSYLSEGYQNVLSWCGDLLYRVTEIFKEYKRPLFARGLLLIDEVDLHLHPIWQRSLIDFITSKLPNFQIIATTHSPLTAHQAGEGELYFLKRDEATGAPKLISYEGDPSKLLLHQLLMSPIFGLQTADSLPVEKMKDEYSSLSTQKGLVKAAKARFTELKQELSDLPEWNYVAPDADKHADLLAKIETALQSDGTKKTRK